ncbi:hypothetical protein DRI96_02445 [Candidatus Aerophobetes bacterium]|uniref:Uncharacterized protein n=1 Tax=Aerophobetes bacterium TaxID=2030807 RepID=A0A662DIQ4_UNCAE|nr:MAG: hypothetical protein DRI96_02445 [Candidatus Aerophobetes bacterium]
MSYISYNALELGQFLVAMWALWVSHGRRPRQSLVSLLTLLQLGLRFLAVLYFSEGQAHLLAKKRLP